MLARSKRISSAVAAAALCAAAFSVPAHAAATRPDPVAVPLAQAGPAVSVNLTQAIARARLTARPARYTVRPGDTLSAIAARYYQRSSDWPVLYWANRRAIRWADEIGAGQVLQVPAEPAVIPGAPALLKPPAPHPVVLDAAYTPAAARSPAGGRAPAAGYQGGGPGTYPGGAFGACVVARESGGNAQVMNASGHWGLYQFSEATWEAYGGSEAGFGDAGVTEQDQVFSDALARGGESNWSLYDNCLGRSLTVRPAGQRANPAMTRGATATRLPD